MPELRCQHVQCLIAPAGACFSIGKGGGILQAAACRSAPPRGGHFWPCWVSLAHSCPALLCVSLSLSLQAAILFGLGLIVVRCCSVLPAAYLDRPCVSLHAAARAVCCTPVVVHPLNSLHPTCPVLPQVIIQLAVRLACSSIAGGQPKPGLAGGSSQAWGG